MYKYNRNWYLLLFNSSLWLVKRNKNPTAVTLLIYILLSLFSISILMFERCIFEAGMAGPWLLRYVRCIFISLLSQRHFATTANVLHNGTKSFLKKQTFSEVGVVYHPSNKRHACFWNEMHSHIHAISTSLCHDRDCASKWNGINSEETNFL